MQKGLSEIVFIVDESESMHGLEKDTIGGFNSMLEKLTKENGEALASIVFFSNESRVIMDRVSLKEVHSLSGKDYVPHGCTALLDAVGGSIHHIGRIHHALARIGRQPEHTIFVIMTDGYENASRMYDYRHVKSLIHLEKEQYGWEFLFLGADIDAEKTAEICGIDHSRSARYHNDAQGIAVNFDVISEALGTLRCSRPLSEHWKDRIDRDYKSR